MRISRFCSVLAAVVASRSWRGIDAQGSFDRSTRIQEPANKQRVVNILMKWLRLPQVEDGVAGYEAIRSLYSRRIFPTVDSVRNTVRILSRIDPKFSKLKAEDLVDERVVRKLEKEGLFK